MTLSLKTQQIGSLIVVVGENVILIEVFKNSKIF